MARQLGGSGIPSRIVILLGERYPITVAEVALALGARPDVVRREVKRLATQGVVHTERLDDKEYVTLTGAGVSLLGLPAKEADKLRARRPGPPPARPDDDPAFG